MKTKLNREQELPVTICPLRKTKEQERFDERKRYGEWNRQEGIQSERERILKIIEDTFGDWDISDDFKQLKQKIQEMK